MRYSYYVEMNRLIENLVDAAVFVLQSGDEPMKKELLRNSRKAWESIQKILQKDPHSRWDDAIFSVVKDCKQLCQDAISHPQDCMETYVAQLESFVSLFESQVQVRYQIVFLSDVAGKWDAMKSVYEAFSRRENCDVTVVLMPVIRVRQTNGKTEYESIYEDYFTPQGISFVEYKQYDLAKNCPDLVFTSNPYDSTVLPQFCSQEVAKVSRLVYLPYFTSDIVWGYFSGVFRDLPLFECAWKVMAQSQSWKDLYALHSVRHGSNAVVSGLAKWDEVVRLRQNGLAENQRRLDWEKKFEGKTVFLWATWYQYQSSSLKYMERFLDYLEHNPEIAFIWRPHPMTFLVTKLYAPAVYEKLKEFEERISSSDRMVVDLQGDYQASFWYSHAMMSDLSSMMTQYLLLDKPVLWIQEDSLELTDQTLLMDPNWMEQAASWEEMDQFVQRICKKEDRNRAIRQKVMQTDFALADGQIGERIAEYLLECMQQEDLGGPEPTAIGSVPS